MKIFKRLMQVNITLVLVFAITISVYAAWVQDGKNWKYEENGVFVVNDWRELDNSIFYFNENGYMATDLTKIGDNYHMFDTNGRYYKKGKEFSYAGETYTIASKGKVEDFPDSEYEEYVKEKAQNEAFKAEQAALKKAEQESIAASKEAYKIEHAAEIAASEAAAEAEKAAKKEAQAKAAAEAKAKSELLISTENRTKLQDTVNRATERKVAVRNLVTELTKQLNERRTSMILEVKRKYTNNEKFEFSDYEVLFNEIVNEYTDVAEGILSVLADKYDMRRETYDQAEEEIVAVLSRAKSQFVVDLDKIE